MCFSDPETASTLSLSRSYRLQGNPSALGVLARLGHRNVNQERRLHNEYLGAENRILKGQINGRLLSRLILFRESSLRRALHHYNAHLPRGAQPSGQRQSDLVPLAAGGHKEHGSSAVSRTTGRPAEVLREGSGIKVDGKRPWLAVSTYILSAYIEDAGNLPWQRTPGPDLSSTCAAAMSPGSDTRAPTADQLKRMHVIFPSGICVYRRPVVGQEGIKTTWQMYSGDRGG
jgi:hypothetical protein